MPSKIVTIKKNPDLEWAVGIIGGPLIPTKQDKFKPLTGYEGIIQEGEEQETIFKDLYIKNPAKDTILKFEEDLRKFIKENTTSKQPYKKPLLLEVILIFTVPKKRFLEVDIDNLSKSILDCMTGLVYEDDSQVINLYASKQIDITPNGLMIGVKILNKPEDSWFKNIKLFYVDDKN